MNTARVEVVKAATQEFRRANALFISAQEKRDAAYTNAIGEAASADEVRALMRLLPGQSPARVSGVLRLVAFAESFEDITRIACHNKMLFTVDEYLSGVIPKWVSFAHTALLKANSLEALLAVCNTFDPHSEERNRYSRIPHLTEYKGGGYDRYTPCQAWEIWHKQEHVCIPWHIAAQKIIAAFDACSDVVEYDALIISLRCENWHRMRVSDVMYQAYTKADVRIRGETSRFFPHKRSQF